jgi:hypothetical protein
MRMSELVTIAKRFRRDLLQEERQAAMRMAEAYGLIWQDVRADLRQLTAQIEQARAAGEEISQAWLARQAHFQQILAQVEGEVTRYSLMVGREVAGQQEKAVLMASAQFRESLRAAGPGVMAVFNQVSTMQVLGVVGALAEGSPLERLLAALGPDASRGIRESLIKGVALGWNPRRMERDARGAAGRVLSDTLRIMRTEGIRPFREYARASYMANSHIISGWYWLSAANSRTCASCWGMHGSFHPVRARLDDHPNGRCTMVPQVRGMSITIPSGPELFRTLDPERQLAVLGAAKFEAYRQGKIDLPDLVGRRDSRAWGTMRFEQSLQAAMGQATG